MKDEDFGERGLAPALLTQHLDPDRYTSGSHVGLALARAGSFYLTKLRPGPIRGQLPA